MNICLKLMTKELCRTFYRKFEMDPALYLDPADFQPYIYEEEKCDAYFDRYQAMGRVHLAVMLLDEPIGEIILKNIDPEQHTCAMGITMVNDRYKNRGYGTIAERMALDYAFTQMGMVTVFADALVTNARSQHVLKKVGFLEYERNERFIYYRCDEPETEARE